LKTADEQAGRASAEKFQSSLETAPDSESEAFDRDWPGIVGYSPHH
jgi:hypothetical protein